MARAEMPLLSRWRGCDVQHALDSDARFRRGKRRLPGCRCISAAVCRAWRLCVFYSLEDQLPRYRTQAVVSQTAAAPAIVGKPQPVVAFKLLIASRDKSGQAAASRFGFMVSAVSVRFAPSASFR